MTRLSEVFRSNERLSSLFCAFFVAVMMACLGASALALGQRLLPGWNGGFLPWFCFIVSLEAIFSQRRLSHATDLDTPVAVYRLVELVVVMVGLKAAIYLWQGWGQLRADLPLWQEDFFGSFLDMQYLLSLLVVALVWILSTNFADDLAGMEGDEMILQAESLEAITSNRGTVQQRLANRVFAVGVGMVFIVSLVRLDMSAMLGGLPPARSGVLHVVVYFVSGLALLSLAQLSIRRAAWAWQRLPVSQGMVRRWVLHSLLFLGLLLLLAFLLPSSYTIGLLPVLSYVFGFILMLAYTLALLIILPVFYFFAWVMSLFGGRPGAPPALPDVQRFIPQAPLAEPGSALPWLTVLRAVVFWALVIGVVAYAFYIYFHQNRDLVQTLRRLPGMAWLVKAWHWLAERVRAGASSVPQAVQAGLRRLGGLRRSRLPGPGFQFVNLRRLTPRQRILFYYLALVRRGGESGLSRQPWQTPYEYAHRLEPELPEEQGALQAMTEAFVEARYSQHPVETVQVSAVQRAWERLRMALRGRKK